MNWLRPIPENIPDELKTVDQWVCWKAEEHKGKMTKVPYNPKGFKASSTNPKTWSSYQSVMQAYQDKNFDGIGFVFSEQSGFIGVDLDHVINESGKVKESEPWALEIVQKLNSYTEVSPSGDGLHIIIKGNIPSSGTDGKPGNVPHLEVYKSGRYFTVTGHLWG